MIELKNYPKKIVLIFTFLWRKQKVIFWKDCFKGNYILITDKDTGKVIKLKLKEVKKE